jgi:hypothetical protein
MQPASIAPSTATLRLLTASLLMTTTPAPNGKLRCGEVQGDGGGMARRFLQRAEDLRSGGRSGPIQATTTKHAPYRAARRLEAGALLERILDFLFQVWLQHQSALFLAQPRWPYACGRKMHRPCRCGFDRRSIGVEIFRPRCPQPFATGM